MNDPGRRLQHEEDILQDALSSGQMTQKEYNDECRYLERAAREYAQEEAERAYQEVMENYDR